MILDNLTIRLFADHGHDLTDAVDRAMAGLRLRPEAPRLANRALPAPKSFKTGRFARFTGFSHAVARVTVGCFGMAVCAGLCLAGATGATPVSGDIVRVQAVSYADLNLSSPAGRAVFDRRIRAAARTVCEISAFGSADRWLRIAEQRCFRDAIKRAEPHMAAISAG